MNVLIVDDSAEDRSILRMLFQAHGCAVREAENGRLAISEAHAWSPDLIISDALMPEMDGFQLLRRAKADDRLREIPFIFYSAVYIGQDEEKLARMLGADAFIIKPLEPEVLWREIAQLVSVDRNRERVVPVSPDEEAYLKEYSQIVAMKLEEKVNELEDLYQGLIRVLVNVIDAKSTWTKGHSDRVVEYAVWLAGSAGLDEGGIRRLKLAALLHDIGKIGTYDSLLDKPGALSEAEYEIIRQHPGKGVQILSDIHQFSDLLPIIRHHHERFDGAGYPDGLAGEEIPLLARILCIADAYDAMTDDRPYRPAPGETFAVSELKRCAGTQFDPHLVDAFLRALAWARRCNQPQQEA